MTSRRSNARRPSDEGEPKVEKETVKDLDPKSNGDDVKGGAPSNSNVPQC